MPALEAQQLREFTTGEFNYQFPDDTTRDRAFAAVVRHLSGAGATAETHCPDGAALEGTRIAWGVSLDGAAAELHPEWFSGFLRIATNEKAVVRAYFSAGNAVRGSTIEATVRGILGGDFGGLVVE